MVASSPFPTSSQHIEKKPAALVRAIAVHQEARRDAELVRRFNAGEESAFVEIMTHYHTRLFAVALAMLKNHADAEEIAQDTFIRAHRGLAKFRGESSLATWLHRIALNLSRNRYWYFFRRHRHATVSLDCPLGADQRATFSELVVADAPGPAHDATVDEFTALVTACTARLGAGQRTILDLRNVRNLSYDEIARELGINVGTVKSRIARARAMLRALLAEACPEFGEHAEPAAWFEPARPRGGVEALCI